MKRFSTNISAYTTGKLSKISPPDEILHPYLYRQTHISNITLDKTMYRHRDGFILLRKVEFSSLLSFYSTI